MANLTYTFQATATFTLTLASLANGSARQSTMIDNHTNNYPAAMVYLKIKSGAAAPTASSAYEVYLLRGDTQSSPSYETDNAGTTDAAITILNAQLLGTIVLTANTATNFYGEFDTKPLGPLGPYWGIAIKNSSGNSLDSTEGNHLKEYAYYQDTIA